VGFGVIVGRGDGEGVGIAVGKALGVATGNGFATATPLFHTNLFPFFIHVYFLPL
jgi:hypothetical protein